MHPGIQSRYGSPITAVTDMNTAFNQQAEGRDIFWRVAWWIACRIASPCSAHSDADCLEAKQSLFIDTWNVCKAPAEWSERGFGVYLFPYVRELFFVGEAHGVFVVCPAFSGNQPCRR